MNLALQDARIAVLGLGYVGLPLAVAFGEKFPTIGFDIDPQRVEELKAGYDRTREVDADALLGAAGLSFTTSVDALADCNVYVVTVPTPIDAHKRPDLTALMRASETVGRVVRSGDIVIYESTVYPGATEEDCVPVIERVSGLSHGEDFAVAYSPERANPGDPEHRLSTITKVVSASSPEALDFVASLYAAIVPAGVFRATSIRVAEAAKVIENTQRDLNIALINELSIIFGRLGIDTQEVLEAAGTKWNFLPFRPGLVGGHCIGVDPYYLTHKAQAIGYHPEIILAGRRINDGMGDHVVAELVKRMVRKRIQVMGARVLVMGLAFKENTPDLRNTRVVDIVHGLQEYACDVEVHDPWVDAGEARRIYGLDLVAELKDGSYDAIVLAVAHREFRQIGAARIAALGRPTHVIYDLKGLLSKEASDLRL